MKLQWLHPLKQPHTTGLIAPVEAIAAADWMHINHRKKDTHVVLLVQIVRSVLLKDIIRLYKARFNLTAAKKLRFIIHFGFKLSVLSAAAPVDA